MASNLAMNPHTQGDPGTRHTVITVEREKKRQRGGMEGRQKTKTKISWSTINFKTKNGSRLITEYYAFTIRVDQVNFLREKFGVSAYSRDRLVAE